MFDFISINRLSKGSENNQKIYLSVHVPESEVGRGSEKATRKKHANLLIVRLESHTY